MTDRLLVTSLIDISGAGFSTAGCFVLSTSFSDGARWFCASCVSWLDANTPSVATVAHDVADLADATVFFLRELLRIDV